MTAKEEFEPMKDPQWVPVITVPTDALAEQYRELLADHEIEVLVGLDQWEAHGMSGADEENRQPGVPVLVLDYLLEEARGIIVEREGESVFDPDIEEEDDDDEHDLDFELSEEDDEEHLYMDEDDHAADPLDELPEFDAPPFEDEENDYYH